MSMSESVANIRLCWLKRRKNAEEAPSQAIAELRVRFMGRMTTLIRDHLQDDHRDPEVIVNLSRRWLLH